MDKNIKNNENKTKNERKKAVTKLCFTALVILLVALAAYLLMKKFGLLDLNQEQIQEIIAKQGSKGPIVFIIITFLQATVLPIPGAVTILAGNYIFGGSQSFIYSYVGMILGSLFSFGLGKLVGRPFVNWLAGGKEKVDEWLVKIRGKEGVILFFMFFFPFFPDDILCAIAGLLPITWGGFTVMQLITRATSVLGTLIFMSGEIIPWRGWGLVILALIAVLFICAFVICFINAEKLDNLFSGIFRKVFYGERGFIFSKRGQKAGKRIACVGKIKNARSVWRVCGLYSCDQGYVVDLYSSVYKKQKPSKVDFDLSLKVDENEEIASEKQFELFYDPKNKKGDKCAYKFIIHYKLEIKQPCVFLRALFLKDEKIGVNKIILNVKKGEEVKEVSLLPTKKSARKILKDLFSKKFG